MPPRPRNHQDHKRLRKGARHSSEKQRHHLTVRVGQQQRTSFSLLGKDSRVNRDKFPNDLARGNRSYVFGCPTPSGIANPTQSGFIGGPNEYLSGVILLEVSSCVFNKVREVFLKSSCSLGSDQICRGRGHFFFHS